MIYTSYYAQAKNLQKDGIELVAISRGKPKWFNGRCLDNLAPTWQMLKMSDEDYDAAYQRILASNDPHEVAAIAVDHDIALLCFEKDINECHRKEVGEWLRKAGYEVEEWPGSGKQTDQQQDRQMALF